MTYTQEEIDESLKWADRPLPDWLNTSGPNYVSQKKEDELKKALAAAYRAEKAARERAESDISDMKIQRDKALDDSIALSDQRDTYLKQAGDLARELEILQGKYDAIFAASKKASSLLWCAYSYRKHMDGHHSLAIKMAAHELGAELSKFRKVYAVALPGPEIK